MVLTRAAGLSETWKPDARRLATGHVFLKQSHEGSERKKQVCEKGDSMQKSGRHSIILLRRRRVS